MANYAISGVWKDGNTITHYAIHELNNQTHSISLAVKTTKANAINLFDNSYNSVITILWNYTSLGWQKGTKVEVVGNYPNKYLRTNHDGTVRDNLGHLINYGLVTNNFS